MSRVSHFSEKCGSEKNVLFDSTAPIYRLITQGSNFNALAIKLVFAYSKLACVSRRFSGCRFSPPTVYLQDMSYKFVKLVILIFAGT